MKAQDRRRELESELYRCVDILVRQYKPEKILVFGSLAGHTVHEYSDIDLIIIKRTDKPFWERLREVYFLVKPREAMDIFVYTPEEWKDIKDRLFFQKEVLPKGRIMYEATK